MKLVWYLVDNLEKGKICYKVYYQTPPIAIRMVLANLYESTFAL